MIAFLIVLILLFSSPGLAENIHMPDLEGISVGMKKSELLDSWGYPDQRDYKEKNIVVLYYLDEDTPNPTDGFIVYMYKAEIKEWESSDNIYVHMDIWGGSAG